MADPGDLGQYGENDFAYMRPEDIVAAALGSNAVINGPDSGSGSPVPSPAIASSPMRGAVSDAALAKPAMSTGANLDMGAPSAPAVAGPSPVSPLQPVLRTAAQPSIPMPQAPAIDPRRAQLESQAATLHQPIDRNSPQFKNPLWKYLLAAVAGTASGFSHQPGAPENTVDSILNSKYDRAETDRLRKLQGVEGSLGDIDKAQQEKEKVFSDEQGMYRDAMGQRREDRAEESQNRRDAAEEQRNSNEDRRLTAVEQAEKDRAAKDAATEKRNEQKDKDTAAHQKAEEGHWRKQDAIADRNASTKEKGEQDRAARYKGVNGADKGKIDKVYSDRDKAIAKLDSEKARASAGLGFLPDGPTKQKQTKAIEDDYNQRVQKVHDSTEQRVKQLGGSYDKSVDGGGANSAAGRNAGSKYKTGDQIPSGKYAGMFVSGIDAQGNYQLSKQKPR
jgi:hypothetical protein